jgi:hypothetical protein
MRRKYSIIGINDDEIQRQNKVKFANETVGHSVNDGIGIRDFFKNPKYVSIREIAYLMIEGETVTLDTKIDTKYDQGEGRSNERDVLVRDCMKDINDFDKMMKLMNDAFAKFVRIMAVEQWEEYYEFDRSFDTLFVVKSVVKTLYSDGSTDERSNEIDYMEPDEELASAIKKTFGEACLNVWFTERGDWKVRGDEISTAKVIVIKLVGGNYVFLSGDDDGLLISA